MRVAGFVFVAASADLCSDGSQCKADGQCKLNNRDPCFGGHCWENFWAEKNCQGDWQSKYPDPGPSTEWISLSNFQDQYPDFDEDILIGNLPGCKNVVDGSWFNDSSLDSCDFDMSLTKTSGPMTLEWDTQFFDMSTEHGVTSDGCKKAPDGGRTQCYCDIALSNDWISITGDKGGSHHEPHPNQRNNDDCATLDNTLSDTKDILEEQDITFRWMRDHANRNFWQMDCIYCGIRHQMLLQEEASDSEHIYEYVVCMYDNYVAKFFNSICQIYEQSNELDELLMEFNELKCDLTTDDNFCNGKNEAGFVDGPCGSC